MIVALIINGVASATLLILGARGLQGGFEPPPWLDSEERASRALVRQRGSVTCLVVGGLLAAATLAGAVAALAR